MPRFLPVTERLFLLLGSVFATLVACQVNVNTLQDTFVGNLDAPRTTPPGPPIDTTDHGAIPDDGADDTQAILEAALAY